LTTANEIEIIPERIVPKTCYPFGFFTTHADPIGFLTKQFLTPLAEVTPKLKKLQNTDVFLLQKRSISVYKFVSCRRDAIVHVLIFSWLEMY